MGIFDESIGEISVRMAQEEYNAIEWKPENDDFSDDALVAKGYKALQGRQ